MWLHSLLQLSRLERLLIDEGEGCRCMPDTAPAVSIAEQILVRLSVRSLSKLSQVSKTLNGIVDRHIERRWSVLQFLSFWFQHPRRFLKMMEATNALICGDNVTRFFRGCVQLQDAIDVCINPNHAYHVSDALAREGYQFHLPGNSAGITYSEALGAVMESYPPGQFLCDGERSVDPSYHGAHYFNFKRAGDSERSGEVSAGDRTVVVRFVRCEPYRHVLAQHSTAFMDHITPKYAVCPFARSSLVTHNSFLVRESRVADLAPVVSEGLHPLAPRLNAGSIVPSIWIRAGLPKRNRIYRELRIGKRYMGDGESLLIPVSGVERVHAKAHAARYGPRFNVADFRTARERRPNAYLLISEPGIS